MLCNFNMKLVGTITLDNFAMGERYTLCTSHYLSPGGGVAREILGGVSWFLWGTEWVSVVVNTV